MLSNPQSLGFVDLLQDPVERALNTPDQTTAGADDGLEQQRQLVEERFATDPAALASQLSQAFAEVSPDVDFTPQERQRLIELQGMASQLSPIQESDEPISRRIPGNPFSIQVGPGLRDLATAVINRERSRRLFGDPEAVERFTQRASAIEQQRSGLEEQLAAELEKESPDRRSVRSLERKIDRLGRRQERFQQRAERVRGFSGELSSLQTEKEQAETQAEAQREFVVEGVQNQIENINQTKMNVLEDISATEADIIEEQVKQTGRKEIEEIKQRGREEIQRLIGDRQKELERVKDKIDPNDPGSQKQYISAANNYAQFATANMELIGKQISNLLQERAKLTPRSSGDERRADIDREVERLSGEFERMAIIGQQVYEDMKLVRFPQGKLGISRLTELNEQINTKYEELGKLNPESEDFEPKATELRTQIKQLEEDFKGNASTGVLDQILDFE